MNEFLKGWLIGFSSGIIGVTLGLILFGGDMTEVELLIVQFVAYFLVALLCMIVAVHNAVKRKWGTCVFMAIMSIGAQVLALPVFIEIFKSVL